MRHILLMIKSELERKVTSVEINVLILLMVSCMLRFNIIMF